MAYRRSTRRSRFRRRRSTRRLTRAIRGTRYRRTRPTRRVMNTRRILQIASTKKQDTMISVDSNNNIGPYNGGSASLLFCPTFRPLDLETTGQASDAQSTRQRTQIFAKGVRERITFSTSGQSPVRWRRVVFSTKNAAFVGSVKYAGTLTGSPTTRVRPLVALNVTDTDAILFNIAQGTKNLDFLGTFDFKTDPQKIKLHYDKTFVLNPGNAAGTTRTFNFYHKLNQNMYYADNEFGNDENTSPFASLGRHGLGNVFIWDIFESAFTTDPATTMQFVPNTTFYWHEK